MRRSGWILLVALFIVGIDGIRGHAQAPPALPTPAADAGLRDADAYYQRGLQRAREGDDGKALADFQRAIELDPKRLEAYKAVDGILSKRGDWDQIIAYWTRFIELRPDSAQAYCERGGAYSLKRDVSHALRDAQKSCSLGYQDCCRIFANYVRSHPGAIQEIQKPSAGPPAQQNAPKQSAAPPGQRPAGARAANVSPPDATARKRNQIIFWVVIAVAVAVRVPRYIRFLRQPKPLPIPFDSAALANGWMPPPELLWETPRKIRTSVGGIAGWLVILALTAFASIILLGLGFAVAMEVGSRTGWGFGLLIFAAFFAATIALLVLGFRAKSYEQRVLTHGVAAPALVAWVEERGNTVIGSGGVDTECFSHYQFQDQAGKLVNSTTQKRFTPGARITVIYDPKNPRHSCVYPVSGYKVVGPGE